MSCTLALVLLLACAGRAPAPAPLSPTGEAPSAPPPPLEVLARVRVLAVGDVLMHGAVKQAARDHDQRDEGGASLNHGGYDWLFEDVRGLVSSADLAFANLETPIAPETGGATRSMVFNSPPLVLDALAWTGFDLVSFANNHVYDQGREGMEETLRHLEDSPLQWVGAGEDCAAALAPRTFELQGLRLAFLGATALFNDALNAGPDEPCVAELDPDAILEQVARAREEGADAVFLSLHWGTEYAPLPSAEQVELAHRLLDGGVDVILGQHPHVLQPVEVYPAADGRMTVVAYSLGNFVSNQSRWYVPGLHRPEAGRTRDGIALELSVLREDLGHGQQRVRLAELRAVPLWTENDALSWKPGQPRSIRVVRLEPALEAARAELEELRAEPEPEPARLAELADRVALYELREQQFAQAVGPFTWLPGEGQRAGP